MQPGKTDPEKTRRPAAAGRFYPQEAQELRRTVEEMLSLVPAVAGPSPKALIVPHAGYRFSGPIAASAYARLRPDREAITRVVLLGPAHFVNISGLAASAAETFETPLGPVPVDTQALNMLTRLPQMTVNDEAHAQEHSIEVQLPFLQVVLREFVLVPLAVGNASVGEICEVLEAVWGGPETRVIVSSDLSHYLDCDAARRLDERTASAIESLDAAALGEKQACGLVSIQGLIRFAARHGLRASTLDLRNSGETAGPRHRVVGYGAFAFEEVGAELAQRR